MTNQNPDKITESHIVHEHKMRRILSISVFSVAAIIVVLWGFAFHNNFINYSWSQSDEKALVDKATASWQEAKAMNETNELSDLIAKEQVRETLTAILTENYSENNTTSSQEEGVENLNTETTSTEQL